MRWNILTNLKQMVDLFDETEELRYIDLIYCLEEYYEDFIESLKGDLDNLNNPQKASEELKEIQPRIKELFDIIEPF